MWQFEVSFDALFNKGQPQRRQWIRHQRKGRDGHMDAADGISSGDD